jgi:hypothetical protein
MAFIYNLEEDEDETKELGYYILNVLQEIENKLENQDKSNKTQEKCK